MHERIPVGEPSEKPYGTRLIQEFRCSNCSYEAIYTLTKTNKVGIGSQRRWQQHGLAYQVKYYLAQFEPGGMVGKTTLKKDGEKSYWVYHVNDPDFPACDAWNGTNFNRWLDERRRDPDTQQNWAFMEPWCGIERNTRRTKIVARSETREAVVATCLDKLNTDKVKGYEIETYMNIDDPVEGLPGTLETYLTRFVTERRDASTTSQLVEALQDIQRVRPLLASIDALEDTLRSRLSV